MQPTDKPNAVIYFYFIEGSSHGLFRIGPAP